MRATEGSEALEEIVQGEAGGTTTGSDVIEGRNCCRTRKDMEVGDGRMGW